MIHVPPARVVLAQLARKMIDEYNARQDFGLTREHIRNIVRTASIDRNQLVEIFIAGFGFGPGENDIARKCSEIFADDVLGGQPPGVSRG